MYLIVLKKTKKKLTELTFPDVSFSIKPSLNDFICCATLFAFTCLNLYLSFHSNSSASECAKLHWASSLQWPSEIKVGHILYSFWAPIHGGDLCFQCLFPVESSPILDLWWFSRSTWCWKIKFKKLYTSTFLVLF